MGAGCTRDSECASDVCLLKVHTCGAKGLAGATCARDSECLSDLCNTVTNLCK